jgi:hypothetical protein
LGNIKKTARGVKQRKKKSQGPLDFFSSDEGNAKQTLGENKDIEQCWGDVAGHQATLER